MLTADQLRDGLEVRLRDQHRAQDNLLTQFQAANICQCRPIHEQVILETNHLSIAENLRRRIAEQQTAIREAERTIRDFPRRDLPTPASSSTSSTRRPAPTLLPPPRIWRGRQTQSSPPKPTRRSPHHAPKGSEVSY